MPAPPHSSSSLLDRLLRAGGRPGASSSSLLDRHLSERLHHAVLNWAHVSCHAPHQEGMLLSRFSLLQYFCPGPLCPAARMMISQGAFFRAIQRWFKSWLHTA